MSLEDCIQRPLEVIEGLFQERLEAAGSDGKPGTVPKDDWGVSRVFIEVFANEEAVSKVPILTRGAFRRGLIRSGTLVRYRGMVQDMFSPELVMEAVGLRVFDEDGKDAVKLVAAKYRDDCVQGTTLLEDRHDLLGQRQTVYCVPCPGESGWCREVADGGDPVVMREAVTSKSHFGKQGVKRSLPTEDEEGAEALKEVEEEPSKDTTKKPKTVKGASSTLAAADAEKEEEEEEEGPKIVVPGLREYDPLPDDQASGLQCLVRLYDVESECPLHVGDMVEVFGVYTFDPLLTYFPPSGKDEEEEKKKSGDFASDLRSAMEEDLRQDPATYGQNPPPSLVPRVQCVCFRRLAPTYPAVQPSIAGFPDDPLTHYSLQTPWMSLHAGRELAGEPEPGKRRRAVSPLRPLAAPSEDAAARQCLEGADCDAGRRALVHFLARNCCGNDLLGAEFLLLHLISKVAKRVGSRAVGNFSLALSNLPTPDPSSIPKAPIPPETLYYAASPIAKSIFEGLEALVPRAYLLPMHIDTLNSLTATPIQDTDADRFRAGALQLPRGTLLVLDETVLQEGRVNDRALRTLQAIKKLNETGCLDYVLGYDAGAKENPVDVSTLLLRSGKGLSPLVPTDVVVPIPTDTEPLEDADLDLDALRSHIAALRLLQVGIPTEGDEAAKVERALAAMRTPPRNASVDDMHLVMTLAQLNAASHGQPSVQAKDVEHVQHLLDLARARLE